MGDLSNMFFIYLIVVFVWLVVASFTLVSIVKKNQMGLPVKVFWFAFIVAAPVLGLMIYLIYHYYMENRV